MGTTDFGGLAQVLAAFFIGSAILIPVVAICARFALKPVMETWIRLRQSETTDQEKILQDRRIALLEAEIQSMQQVLQQRIATQEFDRQLSNPAKSGP